MIRAATEADVPRLVQMGWHFFDAAKLDDITEYNPSSTANMLRVLIHSGILLVVDNDGEVVGAAGALVYPFYFNTDHITGQEVFWWVEPEHRGVGKLLLRAMEDAAREKGAQSFSMIALDALNPDMVGALYRRAGYRASEHSYIKRL